MLQLQTILPDTLELLKTLASQPEMQGMRLVGGTSLALQYGHRQSVDLDFFGKMVVPQEDFITMVARMGSYTILNRTNLILQMVVDGIKVDVIDYGCYEWLDAPVVEKGITLASPKDIAALKINAIEGRGSKKDFIDVYMLLQHYTLDEILGFYAQKYPNHSIFRALLSLNYFEDAEQEAMPRMFIPVSWDAIKQHITDAVNRYQH